MITVGSLFSGIGGMDLGLERAGMKVVWQSEIDPYACKVLKKHWPDVPNLGGITEIEDAPRCDLIAGGFPCQDISNAGKRAGIHGERSSLWFEMSRIIRMVRPRLVLVENVAALLGRGMGRVLGDLAEGGYDSEWGCLPASSLGAHHIRERIFILAYPDRFRWVPVKAIGGQFAQSIQAQVDTPTSREAWMPGIDRRVVGFDREIPDFNGCGMVDGIPSRMDRIRCLGNAVVPQIAQWIGERIIAADCR